VVPAPETGTGPDDYEKAARGHFVKSYDVLDKVDLSGTMDGGPHHEVATFGAIEAVEVGGEIDDDLADVESDEHMGFTGDFDAFSESDADGPDGDGIGELGDDALSQATDEDDDMVVDVESGDGLESIRSSDVLQSVVVDAGLDDDEDAAAQVEQSVSVTGELERVAGSAFSREELRAFHDRVDVFNAMFRIMWRTFARHLGAEATRQRFEQKIAGCLVGYPELFRDVQVADDGSVRATALVNNLTPQAATGGAQETLHQGLYELMFAHMFDAKEFLPPEAEATMMEQVVAFERQLHES
jgi:hypothetical protein